MRTRRHGGATALAWTALAGCIVSAEIATASQVSVSTQVATEVPARASCFVLPGSGVAGIPVAEVSGLAWNADGQLLYGVSDQGYLYHFRLRIDGETLVSVEPAFAAALVDPVTGAGHANSGKRFNAEGLALRDGGKSGHGELVVALEEKPPQLARFDPQGLLLGKLPVPTPANDIANYRKKGRGLESVVLHPRFGPMTAPESPLENHPDSLHTVYAKGHAWSFARYAQGSRLKGLDVLPGGNLLVLERTRSAASKDSLTASLRRVDISTCGVNGVCKAMRVATLPPGPENFEGLTLLDARHALIASDNGDDSAQGTVFCLIALP
jgi:hypothetical protein